MMRKNSQAGGAAGDQPRRQDKVSHSKCLYAVAQQYHYQMKHLAASLHGK